jgi:hypothetical protein
MTEPVEEKPVSFPTILYLQHPDKRMFTQQFDDAASYELARAAGWRSSPASFGVETHPSQPGLALSQGTLLAPASPTSIDLSETTALLLSLQIQLEQMSRDLVQLTQRVAVFETAAPAGRARPPEVARTTSQDPTSAPDEPSDDDKPATRRR